MNYKFYILHGWAYSTEKWKPFVDLLKQKRIDVTLLKIPGLTEKLDKVWTKDDYVEWLKNKIETNRVVASQGDALRNNGIVLIGHSNGGRIALNFAIKYPQKLERLILIDSAGIYHNDLAIRTKRLFFRNVAKITKKITSSEKLRNLLYKIVGESDYKDASPIMRQTMINLINSDKLLNLDKIKTKTLIIWGEGDKVTPLSDGKKMNRHIKDSKLYIVKGAKHSPQFTHTKEVADITLQYIKTKAEDQ